MSDFSKLNLSTPILRAIASENYTTPTPIQEKAIPIILDGRDVLGCAKTGTGKTAAFLLPILQRLVEQPINEHRVIRSLILSPTRELAAQIADNCAKYAYFQHVRHLVIFGGVKQNMQVNQLRSGIDILIATPGRLLDLHGQGFISFDSVSYFVLDEADRMLDMGFLPDIKRILKLLPKERQNLLFTATMPENMRSLADRFLIDPVKIEVDPQSITVEQISQKVMFVAQSDKKKLLNHIILTHKCNASIVFTRTKHGANRVVTSLEKAGIKSAAIHGNKSQNARTKALNRFKSGDIQVLVATDIASRGIDVDGVSHVFNFDLPNVSESYVHRIGRTARAGASGNAIAFCSEEEGQLLWDIEQLIGQKIPEDQNHEWHSYKALEELLIIRVRNEQRTKKMKKKSKNRRNFTYRRNR